jgi:alpha-beta hydrolase superfamily lysophospholipase
MRSTGEPTLSTYTATDGENIAVQDWPLEPGVKARALVLVVHGLGEHAHRHDRLAQQLNAWGFAVRGYDHYGHGESGGVRGALPATDRLVDDLADLAISTRVGVGAGLPLVVLGHSMGGLVAARFAMRQPRSLDALVLSSPVFAVRARGLQKLMLRTLPRLAPNMRVRNGVRPSLLSHDARVVQAYRDDPMVHDQLSARLAGFIVAGGSAVLAKAPSWKVPTLLLYAGADRIVDPEGSRRFAAAAPKGVVTSRCFDALYHEIFNELEAQPVFDALRSWLDQRF